MKDLDRSQSVSEFWQSKRPIIQSMCLDHFAGIIDPYERSEILSYLPDFTQKTVLDLGAGIGRFTREFAAKAKNVTALDLCPHFLEANRQSNAHFSNIEYRAIDAMDADFKPRSFDLIFMSWLLMYLSDAEVVTLSSRIAKWLKPNGHLFFKESCAKTSYFNQTEGYYAQYRTIEDYRGFIHPKLTLIRKGDILAYENSDDCKHFWLYTNTNSSP